MSRKKKSIKQKVKEHFFNNPTDKLRVRQIERVVQIPLPSVIRYTKELVEENILKKEQIANITIFSADRSSKQFIINKKLHNIKKIYNSELLAYLKETFHNPNIVLFGSFAKGEDNEKSDIDLYIETVSTKKINISKYEKQLNKDIQIFRYKSINKVKNKDLANNILNGFVLNGFVEVFNE